MERERWEEKKKESRKFGRKRRVYRLANFAQAPYGTKTKRRASRRWAKKDRLRTARERKRTYGLSRRDLGAIGAGHREAPWRSQGR